MGLTGTVVIALVAYFLGVFCGAIMDDIQQIRELDKERREIQNRIEKTNAEIDALNKQIDAMEKEMEEYERD